MSLLPLKSKVLNSNGRYKMISHLKIGDTLLNHKGNPINVVNVDKTIHRSYGRNVKTNNWYKESTLLYSHFILDNNGLWIHPFQSYAVNLAPLTQFMSFTGTNDKITDSLYLGYLLGVFITKGSFKITEQNKEHGVIQVANKMEEHKWAYLFSLSFRNLHTFTRGNNLYIDENITNFLKALMNDIPKYIVSNKENHFLLTGIKAGIVENCTIDNVSETLLEIAYLITILNEGLNNNRVMSVEIKDRLVDCSYVHFDTDDSNVSFIIDNIPIKILGV